MSKRVALVAALAALVAAVAARAWWSRTPPPAPEGAEPAVASAAPARVPPPQPVLVPAHEESLLYRPTPPEVRDELLSMEEVQARLEEAERQAEATRRFHAGADEGRYTARDLNRSVVDLFRTVELEPVLDEQAMMLGLRIDAIFENSPLLRAGLREGDLLTSINEVPLRDPAELPSLLARLERDLTLCVERADRELCRDLTLD